MSQNIHESGDGDPDQSDVGRESQPAENVQNETVDRKPTQKEIALAWGGCSVPYVSKCIRQLGCPDHSVEAAVAWRLARASRGAGYRTKGSGGSGNPPPAGQKIKVRKRRLSGIEASLQASISVEEQALRLVEEAMASEDDEKLPLRITSYNKAKDGRLESEKRVQEHLKSSRVLVPLDEALSLIKRGWGPLLSRLRSVAKNAAVYANPDDDVRAEKAIREEIEKAIAEASRQYEAAVV